MYIINITFEYEIIFLMEIFKVIGDRKFYVVARTLLLILYLILVKVRVRTVSNHLLFKLFCSDRKKQISEGAKSEEYSWCKRVCNFNSLSFLQGLFCNMQCALSWWKMTPFRFAKIDCFS